jgi:hypothetical protein
MIAVTHCLGTQTAELAASRLDMQFEALEDEKTDAEVEARLKELEAGTTTALPVGGSNSS